MVPESFVRSHFWVQRGRLYRPLCSFGKNGIIGFQWSHEELFFVVEESSTDFFSVSWPKYKDKDALIVYVDTKPSLKARSMQRHCHQFLILPEAVEGVQTKEITRFNGYDSRALVKDNALLGSSYISRKARGYEVRIPIRQLFGYDEEMSEISFAMSYFSTCESAVLHMPIQTVFPEKVPYMWPVVHLEGSHE